MRRNPPQKNDGVSSADFGVLSADLETGRARKIY
jgi:hypothetical protein